jgi:cell division transport system permease protein
MSAQVNAWLSRHAQTLVGSLGRMAQQPVATGLTLAVVAVALALPLFLNVLLANTRALTANWNQAFEISVYLDKKASAERAAALAKQLRLRSDVAQVHLITADQALADFRETSGFGKALDALDGNPLPYTLIVTPTVAASTPAGTAMLKASVDGMPDVELAQLDTEWVQRLDAMVEVLRRVLWLTGSLLGLSAVLVIGNTIRLDILNRRTEIEVMKLVGATDGFARRPFLYSGVWYGLGGGLLAVVLVAGAVTALAAPLQHLASLYGSSFRLEGLRSADIVRILALAIGLGWLGSWIAATRHIRSSEG